MSEQKPKRILEHVKVKAALERLGRGQPRERCGDAPPSELLKAIHEFNAGEFFDQHETLELMWRAETGDIRFLYQGVLHVGVGFYHLQNGNFHGATTKLGTGIAMLEHFRPECLGVDVDRLVREAYAARVRILELGPTRMREFDAQLIPRVHVQAARTGRE
jgi:predicted metal-dependent hydrolase